MLLVQLIVPSVGSGAEVAKGADLPHLRECVGEVKSDCILSVKGIFPDGRVIEGKTTGRTRLTDWVWGKNSRVVGPMDEWEFEGVTFENGTGKFFINSFHFPDGITFCWPNEQCNSRVEQFNLYALPSDLDSRKAPVALKVQAAKIRCPNNPADCNIGANWSFLKDFQFQISFAFSSSFNPAVTLGRVKGITLAKIDNPILAGNQMQQVDLTFSPLLLGHLLYDQPDKFALDTSTHETDEPAIWVLSTKHAAAWQLGFCGFHGGLIIVSNSNGTQFPTWNIQNQSIEVVARAAHFRPDGTQQKGYLEVRIPIEMAKCLWGIDLNGEVYGNFSITYPDSDIPEVLTVTGSITGKDYLLVSTGFHYSAPTIAIQMKNTKSDLVALPDPSPTPAPIAQPVKKTKKSITCKKGAKLKKVSAVSPKCPTGYKKAG